MIDSKIIEDNIGNYAVMEFFNQEDYDNDLGFDMNRGFIRELDDDEDFGFLIYIDRSKCVDLKDIKSIKIYDDEGGQFLNEYKAENYKD